MLVTYHSCKILPQLISEESLEDIFCKESFSELLQGIRGPSCCLYWLMVLVDIVIVVAIPIALFITPLSVFVALFLLLIILVACFDLIFGNFIGFCRGLVYCIVYCLVKSVVEIKSGVGKIISEMNDL